MRQSLSAPSHLRFETRPFRSRPTLSEVRNRQGPSGIFGARTFPRLLAASGGVEVINLAALDKLHSNSRPALGEPIQASSRGILSLRCSASRSTKECLRVGEMTMPPSLTSISTSRPGENFASARTFLGIGSATDPPHLRRTEVSMGDSFDDMKVSFYPKG